MLEILVRGGRTVQELQEQLALGQPIVSQQLAVLRHQGIVSAQKEGLSVRYALRDPLGAARRRSEARQLFEVLELPSWAARCVDDGKAAPRAL